MKNLYPIGSVVLLKGAFKKLMIIGYYSMDEGKNVIYDYAACLYPEGLLTSSQTFLFNHSQIDKVFFEGYRNEEYNKFVEKMDETFKKESEE